MEISPKIKIDTPFTTHPIIKIARIFKPISPNTGKASKLIPTALNQFEFLTLSVNSPDPCIEESLTSKRHPSATKKKIHPLSTKLKTEPAPT